MPARPDVPSDLVYGRNPVREAMRGKRRVFEVWATDAAGAGLAAGAVGPEAHPVTLVSADDLDRICGSPDHQGMACALERYPYVDATALLDSEDALVMVLDQVQDPQNLGAICRVAECAGAAGVVIPDRRAAQVTPAVCRASAGAVEHLAVARVRNVADFLTDAKGRGAWIYGAEAGAPVPYTEPDYQGRTVLVVGGEGSGLRPRVRAACDQVVSIPLRGAVESLNVSAASALLLYEALRPRVAAP
jgi:23S rRNA (guanosine2251-2'-O)-methyltransferase